MAKRLQLRRGTTAEIAAFTGAVAEPTYDTTTGTMQIHNGAVAGGTELCGIVISNSNPGASRNGSERLHFNTSNGGFWIWNGSSFTVIIKPRS